jgi:hypothetical protein
MALCTMAATTLPAQPTFTRFEAPGAGTGHDQGTSTFSINAAGTIAGYYLDASDVFHGFVRAASGTITSFDAPGAGTAENQGTATNAINTAGDIAGQ